MTSTDEFFTFNGYLFGGFCGYDTPHKAKCFRSNSKISILNIRLHNANFMTKLFGLQFNIRPTHSYCFRYFEWNKKLKHFIHHYFISIKKLFYFEKQVCWTNSIRFDKTIHTIFNALRIHKMKNTTVEICQHNLKTISIFVRLDFVTSYTLYEIELRKHQIWKTCFHFKNTNFLLAFLNSFGYFYFHDLRNKFPRLWKNSFIYYV